MPSDPNTYRTAQILIREHGRDASIHAAMRADELLDKGDLDGAAVWRRIIAAIEELLRETAGEGEAIH